MSEQLLSSQTAFETLKTSIKDLLDAHEQHLHGDLKIFTNVRARISEQLEQLQPSDVPEDETKDAEDNVRLPPTPPDSDRDEDEDIDFENEARRLRAILSPDAELPGILNEHEEEEKDDDTHEEDKSRNPFQNDKPSTGTYNTFDDNGDANPPQTAPRDP
jgi:hypothetical protein